MKKGTCKHFNGMVNERCDADVRYYDVTPDPDGVGCWRRTPCHRDRHPNDAEEFGQPGTCEKYEEPTPEEIAAYEAEIEASHQRMLKTLPVIRRIKEEHKGESWQGVEKCPVCDGKLHMSHAACNGHVHGRCETDGCVAWME